MAHRVRAPHVARHPVHLTLRRTNGLPSLRSPGVFPQVRDALRASSSTVFRVIHYSVQLNHIHLIVEAEDRQGLMRGASGLTIRVAKAVNRGLGRNGPRTWLATDALPTPLRDSRTNRPPAAQSSHSDPQTQNAGPTR